MKKREWILVILPLLIVWTLDRLSKNWASVSLQTPMDWPYLHFVLYHNHGAMLGLFSDLPAVLRIVSLSTAGSFLVCIYAIIQYLLPIKSLSLRTGMSILLGGILGNVTDRILWGYVVDFIIVGSTKNLSSPAFNVADALQWIGYGLIVYAIIKEGDLLWPEKNSRKLYWVNPKFQLKYCFLLMGVGVGLSLIATVFAYTFLRDSIVTLVGENQHILSRFLTPFLITSTFIALLFSMALFAIGKVISHKIAGPLYGFERYLLQILEGQTDRNFRVRAKDEFKNLEELAEKIRVKMIEVQKLVDKQPPVDDSKTQQ